MTWVHVDTKTGVSLEQFPPGASQFLPPSTTISPAGVKVAVWSKTGTLMGGRAAMSLRSIQEPFLGLKPSVVV